MAFVHQNQDNTKDEYTFTFGLTAVPFNSTTLLVETTPGRLPEAPKQSSLWTPDHAIDFLLFNQGLKSYDAISFVSR